MSPRLLRRADLCPMCWLSSRDVDVKLSCYMCKNYQLVRPSSKQHTCFTHVFSSLPAFVP